MTLVNNTRQLPREKTDTGHMRPNEQRKHDALVARAAAMSTGGVPPKTTIKPRY